MLRQSDFVASAVFVSRRSIERVDRRMKRGGSLFGRSLWIAGILTLVPLPAAATTLSYSHLAGSISPPLNNGNGGILKVNQGPYRYSGNGTSTIRITDPANTPPEYELWAIAGLNGFTKLFSGSKATGAMSVAGRYRVTGAPPEGADGVLEGTASYHNYIATAGVGKLLGSGTTSLTSSISVDPFASQSPGPSPNPTTLSAAFGTASAGNLANVSQPYGDAATGITNGSYAVNFDLHVTASRTAGAVTATAAWISHDFSWTLNGAPPVSEYPMPAAKTTSGGYPEPGQIPSPMVFGSTLREVATQVESENLLVGTGGELFFSSLDPSSVLDPARYATHGPSFTMGNATGLEYLSDLVMSPDGAVYGLQSFGFDGGNINPNAAGLLTIDPATGTTAPVVLSESLAMPSSLAFVESGFGGAQMLITQLGMGSGENASLLGVDAMGNVNRLISDLGVDNPVDLQMPSGDFSHFGDKAFILDVGEFTGVSIRNGSGSVLLVDEASQLVMPFITGLANPLEMAFADGSLLGSPDETYLYVLEQGDLDPTTGIPLGNGVLAAYDVTGNRTEVMHSIAGAASLAKTADGSGLYVTSGQAVFLLAVPEPTTGILLACGLFGLPLLGHRTGRARRVGAGRKTSKGR